MTKSKIAFSRQDPRQEREARRAPDDVVGRDAASAVDHPPAVGVTHLVRLGLESSSGAGGRRPSQEVVVEIRVVALDESARRRVVLGGGHGHRGSPSVSGMTRWTRPLPNVLSPTTTPAIVVLDRARDDLARRRRSCGPRARRAADRRDRPPSARRSPGRSRRCGRACRPRASRAG